MKKFLVIAIVFGLIGSSSENEENEWLQPRQCMELALQNNRCDLDPDCEREKPEGIEANILKAEEHGCVYRKNACINDIFKDEDVKCRD